MTKNLENLYKTKDNVNGRADGFEAVTVLLTEQLVKNGFYKDARCTVTINSQHQCDAIIAQQDCSRET